jgi:hypothetical protein
MYVPMETNPVNSKAGSRENTDYDTFGSIDSLIFEPKIPTQVREYILFLVANKIAKLKKLKSSRLLQYYYY